MKPNKLTRTFLTKGTYANGTIVGHHDPQDADYSILFIRYVDKDDFMYKLPYFINDAELFFKYLGDIGIQVKPEEEIFLENLYGNKVSFTVEEYTKDDILKARICSISPYKEA